MRSIIIAGLFVLIGTAAQADIACDERGCRETGKRLIYGDSGGGTYHQCVTSNRNGKPQKVCFKGGIDGYKN
jgi:hypothetical protein